MNILSEKEKLRRHIVSIVFIIYFLLIFEGAIRKWIFPSGANILFFIRVPFVLWVYWIVIKHKIWPRMTFFLFLGLCFAGISLFLAPLQMILGEYDARHWILVVYGWHNYFFYIPLAFIIAENFSQEDLFNIIKITLLIAILVVPLVVLQFFLPPDSILVRGFGGQFVGLAHKGVVRTMGLFTSSIGQQLFVASVIAFVFVVWLSPIKKYQVGIKTLWIATFSIMPLVGLSIQRGLLIHGMVVFLFTILAGLVILQGKILSNMLMILFIIVLLGILYPILLPQGAELFYDRWTGAYLSESKNYGSDFGIFVRLVHGVFKFITMLEHVPLQGYLLGLGGNAVSSLDWVIFPEQKKHIGSFGWSEDGLSRNIIELGTVFGLLFVVYRFAFLIWLFYRAFDSAKITKQPTAIILLGFLTPLMLYLQITGHGSIIGYTWLFIGFCMAAIKVNNSRTEISNAQVLFVLILPKERKQLA
jgi:hypothetical protein